MAVGFSMVAAIPPKAEPTPSSKARIPLDFAICRDKLEVLIVPGRGGLSGEIYSGGVVLRPDLIKGVRSGIEIVDKETLFQTEARGIAGLIDALSEFYSKLKGDDFAKVSLDYRERLNRFLLTRDGARIMLGPSLTYNHLSAPFDLNERWVGSDIESYSSSDRGRINANVEDSLNLGLIDL